MSPSLILSITTRDHKSGIVAASLSRTRSTVHKPIERYVPLKTTASALRNAPAYVPIKSKPETRQTTLAHRSKTPFRRATGDIFMDATALSDPSNFNVAQVRWARTAVRELEAEAIHKWTLLLHQCRERFGYEYPEVVKRAESGRPRDLYDEDAIRGLAFEATWIDAGGNLEAGPSASEEQCEKLQRSLESLRARLGYNHAMEEMLKSEVDEEDANMELY